jgi:hypothetical protein
MTVPFFDCSEVFFGRQLLFYSSGGCDGMGEHVADFLEFCLFGHEKDCTLTGAATDMRGISSPKARSSRTPWRLMQGIMEW